VDSHKVGLCAPPLETPKGWLLLYHGVRTTAAGRSTGSGWPCSTGPTPAGCLHVRASGCSGPMPRTSASATSPRSSSRAAGTCRRRRHAADLLRRGRHVDLRRDREPRRTARMARRALGLRPGPPAHGPVVAAASSSWRASWWDLPRPSCPGPASGPRSSRAQLPARARSGGNRHGRRRARNERRGDRRDRRDRRNAGEEGSRAASRTSPGAGSTSSWQTVTLSSCCSSAESADAVSWAYRSWSVSTRGRNPGHAGLLGRLEEHPDVGNI